MASASTHRAWAAQNEAFYKSLGGSSATAADWALTGLFYACVHEANAFFLDRGKPIPSGHPVMKSALSDPSTAWTTLGQLYEQFQGWSTKARYHCWMPSSLDLQLAERQLALIRGEIDRLNLAELGVAPTR